MLTIKGYKYIQHNITPRPWGIECQYTIAKDDGTLIDSIVMLNDEKVDDEALTELINNQLVMIDTAAEPESMPIEAEPVLTDAIVMEYLSNNEHVVETYLKDTGYIDKASTLSDMKDALAEASADIKPIAIESAEVKRG